MHDAWGGFCLDCDMQIGKLNFDEIQECIICFEERRHVVLNCGHKVCTHCWKKITSYQVVAGEERDSDEEIIPMIELNTQQEEERDLLDS